MDAEVRSRHATPSELRELEERLLWVDAKIKYATELLLERIKPHPGQSEVPEHGNLPSDVADRVHYEKFNVLRRLAEQIYEYKKWVAFLQNVGKNTPENRDQIELIKSEIERFQQRAEERGSPSRRGGSRSDRRL